MVVRVPPNSARAEDIAYISYLEGALSRVKGFSASSAGPSGFVAILFGKLEALRTTLNPRVIYGTKFCDWSWQERLQRDKKPAALGRVAIQHMASFSAAPPPTTSPLPGQPRR